jgi:hypothetical protein
LSITADPGLPMPLPHAAVTLTPARAPSVNVRLLNWVM